jgi:inward rectifier potassium channel
MSSSLKHIRKAKVTLKDGQLHVEGIDSWYRFWTDPYHFLIAIPWYIFGILIFGGYILVNTLFACLYLLCGDCISGARPHNFIDAFFFSVQTLASIGYGVMSPKGMLANAVVTLEAVVSLIIFAVTTGLCFARFSKPTNKVIFSNVAVITNHQGAPTLMFRVANARSNRILDCSARLHFAQDETTFEGEIFRKFYDLKLVLERSPGFALTWTIMHVIDENSPLFDVSRDSLDTKFAQLFVTLSGQDETVSYQIHSYYAYGSRDILLNKKFANSVSKLEDGSRVIDYSKISEIV